MAENQERNAGSNAVASGSNVDESAANGSREKQKKTVEKKRPKHVHVCEVRLLDGTELVIEVEKNADGEVLFSKVVENLDIIDKEYFGLRFTRGSEPTKCWLVLQKPIRKQLNIGELKFQFAVKFYEPEPGKHLDEYTRYLLYLQLREDIVYGRLACPARTYILLASFTAQAEFGDYDSDVHGLNYLDGYELGPEEVENDPKFMSKVIELHKEHSGQAPAEAEMNFLEVAKRTPRYGVDIHYAKNKKDDIEVGVSYKGIFVYQDGEPVDSYGWKAIDLVAYKRKKFMLKLFRSEKRKNPRFRLKGRRESKNLYKSAIEHHAFFRMTNSDRSKRRSGSFIGSKFRYSDRTLYQIRSDPSVHDRQRDLKFARAPSKRQKVKSRRERKPDSNDRTEEKIEAKVPDNLASEVKKPDEDYEEIELDQPYDERYEWVIVKKVLPDGTKKEYRRRIVSSTATTVTETTYVIRKGTEEEAHMMEEKPIETPRKDDVTLVRERMESPEICEKEEVKVEEGSKNHQEVIVTTVITKEAITKPEVEDDVEEPMSLAELKAASKKPSAAVKPLMRDDIEQEAKSKVSETTTTTTTTKKVLVYDVDKEETIKIVSKEERERELREREKQREIEEEQRRQDEIRARNEREAANRRKWKEQEERKRKEEELERRQKEEEEEKIRRAKAMSPELQEISLSTGNEEFDKEFGIKGMDTFLIKTSPMPSSFMKDLEEELSHSLVDDDDVDVADGGLNEENVVEEEKKESTLDVPVIEEPRKAKTLDRKFMRRPPPERSSGYIRRSYGNELDFDYSYGSRTMPRKPRKYVPLITKEELVRAYSSGGLHDESIIRSKQEPQEDKSKIEYSLKDESGVEQGQQGFVKNLIGRHETIKLKEDEEVEEQRRSRIYSSSDDVKLFVPTRTASFGNVEKPESKKTKVPPPVKTKPVVFAADRSGLSAIVVTRPASAIELSSPVVAEANIKEGGQPSNPTEVRKYSIPEVTTSTVVFDSSIPIEKKTTSDDVIVATQTIAVSPADQAEPSNVTGSPIVTPPPPDVINHSDSILTTSHDVTDDAFPTPPPDVITQTMAISPTGTSGTTTTTIVTEEIVQSHQNPPEVETRTVILSGDGISKEDFERMISSESVTTSETTVSKTIKTEVTTVSSGQRVIITGEGEINEDLQQAFANAAVGNGE